MECRGLVAPVGLRGRKRVKGLASIVMGIKTRTAAERLWASKTARYITALSYLSAKGQGRYCAKFEGMFPCAYVVRLLAVVYPRKNL